MSTISGLTFSLTTADNLVTRAISYGVDENGNYTTQKVNTDGTISIDNGATSTGNSTEDILTGGATFSGLAELNEFPDVMVVVKTDLDGILYADFSSDGVNWDSTLTFYYYTAGNYTTHVLVKGARYFRVRFVNTTVSTQSYIRLYTYYGSFNPISAPLNQSISQDQDATIVRSVGVGQQPDGNYLNNLGDGLGFSTTSLLANGATYDSGILSLIGYTQVQTQILSSHIGDITIDFCSDSAGTDILRTLAIPYTELNILQVFAAPAFTPYVRYRFNNDSGSTQTDFYFDTKFITKAISGQILGLSAFISPLMVANLGRNVIVGVNGDGGYQNVSTVQTSNNSGTYNSLQVVSGARPSEIFGRSSVALVLNAITASGSIHTVTAENDFYVTDILLTILNTSTSQTGVLRFENGNGGTVIIPFLTAQGKTNEPQLTTITHSFIEPIIFTTEVYLTISSGTLTISGVIKGYEE